MARLFHFSEDPSIRVFTPHVPATNRTQPPSVWAIDEAHSPLYWFPRDCPRATAWPRTEAERADFRRAFETSSERVHAVEAAWRGRMVACVLYRYEFEPAPFRPWAEASGQYVSSDAVEPLAIEPVGDLLARHAAAGIELRFVPNLWPVIDLVVAGPWDFSIVRTHLAAPRAAF